MHMHAQQRFFDKIINGATQFVVPVFQRDYSWKEENCRQLWGDILRIADEQGEKGHFIGSVVYIPTGDSSAGFTRWLLIDGQQRVTTLTLLLAALRDHIRKTGWTGTNDGPTAKKIEAYFLRNAEEAGEREAKLRLRRHDDATLQSIIFETQRPAIQSEKIIRNYELFYELLQNSDIERVYRGINRVILVDVTLARGVDDPQQIFESLNSTGVDLSSLDLVRNFILMSLTEREQTRLHEAYWSKIDDLFRRVDGLIFGNFIRDYLALRTRPARLERADRVYDAFRREFSGVSQDLRQLEALLEDILRRAKQYAAFTIECGADERSRAFVNLRHLGDSPAILIMQLLECREVIKSLSESELLEAVRLLESYMLRRAIIGAQNKGYSIEFAKVAYRIDYAKPLASLKAAMALMPSAYSFPEDEEFSKALVEGDLYHKRVCFHLLVGLENRDRKEQCDTSAYSIEHIMPQNEKLPEAWRALLGENWRQVQQNWLHRLGNLTLTGYNSTYKDRPLSEKQSIPNGFMQSSVRLNQDVRGQCPAPC
jgi:hypothetical protein